MVSYIMTIIFCMETLLVLFCVVACRNLCIHNMHAVCVSGCQSSRCCSSHVEVGIALYGSMITLAQRMIMATSSRQRNAMQARVRPWSTSTKAGSAVPSTSMTAFVCCCCCQTHPHSLFSSWCPVGDAETEREKFIQYLNHQCEKVTDLRT